MDTQERMRIYLWLASHSQYDKIYPMKLITVSLYPLSIFFLCSCAKICETDPVTLQVPSTRATTIKTSEIPCSQKGKFESAARLALKAVHSPEFEKRLKVFAETELDSGKHVPAWKDVDVSTVILDMRSQINGTYATSYGNIVGLWKFLVFGNVAYDGTKNGPIRFNRWALSRRTIPQVANTIAHEVAHRIGLKHPSSGSSMKVADKEPAYVVGNIIEDIVTELSKQ